MTGRRLLIALLQRFSQREVAASIGVTRQAVSRWACGDCKPRHAQRRALFDRYEIGPESWGAVERYPDAFAP